MFNSKLYQITRGNSVPGKCRGDILGIPTELSELSSSGSPGRDQAAQRPNVPTSQHPNHIRSWNSSYIILHCWSNESYISTYLSTYLSIYIYIYICIYIDIYIRTYVCILRHYVTRCWSCGHIFPKCCAPSSECRRLWRDWKSCKANMAPGADLLVSWLGFPKASMKGRNILVESSPLN